MKIAIIQSSKSITEKLIRFVSHHPSFNIVWIANDGEEAADKCILEPPDLILIDFTMPAVDRVSIVQTIMQKTPCAILITTSNMRTDQSKIFEAMGYGALDAISINWAKINTDPDATLELVSKLETIGKLLGKNSKSYKNPANRDKFKAVKEKEPLPPLLVIGSSTGGPAAIVKIISCFPKKVPFATVIIQHLDEKFTKELVNWLGQHTSVPVKLAHDQSVPAAGTILVAAKNHHLILTPALELIYTSEPSSKLISPSIDVFFESVAEFWPEKSIAALLTGMGKDGAYGLKKLHDAGWYTIVEHEKSCIVYGMPKVAIGLGAASVVLEIEKIGPSILSFLNVKI